MSWIARLAMRLYPRQWRQRYGAELQALVEDSGTTWQSAVDVTKGALIMRLTAFDRPVFAVSVCALLGAAAGAVAVAAMPVRHASAFTIAVESSAPTEEGRIRALISKAFSDANLQGVIEQFGLYGRNSGQPESADAVLRFRQDIGVTLVTPKTVQVSVWKPSGSDGSVGVRTRVSKRLAALLVETCRCSAEADIPIWSMTTPVSIRVEGEPRPVTDRANALRAIGPGLTGGAVAGLMFAAARRRRQTPAS